ncbi:MAG: DUF5721 family protein [Lachnospiraceae bacterium]|nr:DUF5721 family protein [Lachnospiraceae bacterium]
MRAFDINNHRGFMQTLLCTDKFDHFLLKEAELRCGNTYRIDGYENKDFWGSDPDIVALSSPFEYAPWSRMRQTIFQLIKGHNTPLSFRITLYLNPELTANIIKDNARDLDYLILNIVFDDKGMRLTTAAAYRSFTLDKSPEQIWDDYMGRFINEHFSD